MYNPLKYLLVNIQKKYLIRIKIKFKKHLAVSRSQIAREPSKLTSKIVIHSSGSSYLDVW